MSNDTHWNLAELTEKERRYMHELAPTLQPGGMGIPVIRSVLTRAKNEGLDPEKIYNLELRVRPARWKPAPPYEDVRPL